MTGEFDDLRAWHGLLPVRTPSQPAITIRAPMRRAQSSGAGAFLSLADDGRQYWVKVPGNDQGNQVLVNEVIVGALGLLLDAPVREHVIALVPPGLSLWNDFPVRRSNAGLIAHASLHVPGAEDADELRYTGRDGNSRRQAALMGLWDLCVGEDPQWLYETTSAYSMWSYDHGLWFTTGEGDWDSEVLARLLEVDGSMAIRPNGLDADRFEEMAQALRALTPDQLLTVVSAVPLEWEADDRNLEAMAWFLFRRRESVAARLTRLAELTSGTSTTGPPT